VNLFQFRVWSVHSKRFCKPVKKSGDTDYFDFVLKDAGFLMPQYCLKPDDYVFQLSTGKLDKNGKQIFAGDVIKLNNKSEHTLKAYWFPIFEVTWNGFEFGLKHLGGGKAGDSAMFTLRYYSTSFEVIGNIFESTIIIPK